MVLETIFGQHKSKGGIKPWLQNPTSNSNMQDIILSKIVSYFK